MPMIVGDDQPAGITPGEERLGDDAGQEAEDDERDDAHVVPFGRDRGWWWGLLSPACPRLKHAAARRLRT